MNPFSAAIAIIVLFVLFGLLANDGRDCPRGSTTAAGITMCR